MDLDLAKENVEKRKPYLSEKNYKSIYNSIYETEYYNRAAAAAGGRHRQCVKGAQMAASGRLCQGVGMCAKGKSGISERNDHEPS